MFYSEEDVVHDDNFITVPSQSQQRKPIWRVIHGSSTSRSRPQWLGIMPQVDSIQTPTQYFRHFFDSYIMNHIVMQSNLYAVQIDPEKPLQLTVVELERFLGVVFFMSIISLPNSRLYWSLDQYRHGPSKVKTTFFAEVQI